MKRNACILVVEDERIVARDIQATLQRSGHSVPEIASSGKQAIALAEEIHPDLVLMDIVLPGEIDGIQAAGEIGERLGIPVIFLTAYSDDPIIERARAVEPIGYILKPYGEKDLLTTIEMSLHQFITTRNRTEEALRRSEAYFRALTEKSSDLISVLDQDGITRYSSPSVVHLLGFEPDELIGTSIFDMIHPDDMAMARPIFEQLLNETGPIPAAILRTRHKNGSYRWFEAQGANLLCDPEINGIIVNARDITARKLAEDALKESESRYRRLFEDAPEAIWIHDGNLLMEVNPAAAALLGYERPEELVGVSVLGLVHPQDRERVRTRIQTALQTASVLPARDFRMLHREGRTIYAEITASPCDYHGRKALQVFLRDTTERRLAEIELRKANRALKLISECNEVLVRATDETSLLNEICRNIVVVGGYRLAWVGYREQDQAKSIRPVAQAGFEEGYLETLKLTWEDADRGRGPSGESIRSRQPVACRNIQNDPKFTPWRGEALRRGYMSSIALPMIHGDETLGMLAIYASEPDAFGEDEVALLFELANDLTYGIITIRARAARAAAEIALQQQFEHLNALNTINIVVMGSLNLRLTLRLSLEQIIRQIHVDAADVMLLNPHTHILEPGESVGFRVTDVMKLASVHIGEGIAGKVALERTAIFVARLDEQDENAPFIAAENFVSYYGIPLVVKGQLLGVLEIFHRTPLNPNTDWVNLLESFARQAAISIDNAVLFDNLQRSKIDLEMAYDTTLEGWSRALDLRDKETEGHTLRVTEMSMRLAKAVGMSENEIIQVRRGALLHDIGKMGVPDAILLKPDGLTPEEWVVMRKHPVYAYELLYPIKYLRPAVDIPYCHHEKWDGSGYPRGLKGEQIPLSARLFAIVDVWDALCSDRPYRPGLPVEEVYHHILNETGRAFDPKIVEAFLNLVDQT